ncbi:hypothetical protein [Nostoc sp. GT001]|uniref:hypothetical protein n=1 Tax=Nostoc sp. GT001 TaxID=3056647 RepID=UPI0025AAA9DD|nr:hypothetical protein [Nostoc sp. GT001]MDM9585157.1 hypothetical protein [Nostoc sp. GT001]
MTNLSCRKNVTAYQNESLEELVWAIKASKGKFSLLLAHCNDLLLQDAIREHLRTRYEFRIQEVFIDKSDTKLYTFIEAELINEQVSALMVCGLESVTEIDTVLITTNLVRNNFKNFSLPIVIWVNDKVIVKLQRKAADFYSWTTTTQFEAIPDESR